MNILIFQNLASLKTKLIEDGYSNIRLCGDKDGQMFHQRELERSGYFVFKFHAFAKLENDNFEKYLEVFIVATM